MTVREWFRVLRASAWEDGGVPEVQILLRAADQSGDPFVNCRLASLVDYQRFIDGGGRRLYLTNQVRRWRYLTGITD